MRQPSNKQGGVGQRGVGQGGVGQRGVGQRGWGREGWGREDQVMDVEKQSRAVQTILHV